MVTGTVKQLADGSYELAYSFVPQDGREGDLQRGRRRQPLAAGARRPAEDCANPCTGTIKFTQALGYGGRASIQAAITRNGMPVDNQSFASYTAPDLKPGKVSQVRARPAA